MGQHVGGRAPRETKYRGSRSGAGSRAALAAAVVAALAGTATITVPVQAFAQVQEYRFTEVEITGNRRIEPATILSFAGIARGAVVTAADLNDAYQRILGSGLFETVEITPRGSTLRIAVTERPTVNVIAIEGNARIDDEQLNQLIQSQSRRVFVAETAEADAARIAEAYAQQGRIAAQVTPRIIRRSDNRVDLVFEVLEGSVSEVERIAIVGNQAYSDWRLRRVLGTKQAGILRFLVTSDTFIEDRIAFDEQLLRDFYASRGYVDFRVTNVNAELSEERDAFFITFNIEEGQQFRVGAVDVQSDLPDIDPDLYRAALSMETGDVYSPTRVENNIARLERQAVQQGLNFIRVEPRVTRNDRDLTLDVTYEISRGERVFVERIDIEGNTTTLDRVIRQQFDTVEGDPFNPRAIRATAERIRALGFFAEAEVEAREGSTPQQVIIDVDVEERPTGSISFGGSYSVQTGIGAVLSFSERNFLGRGQRLSFSLNTAAASRQYSFAFVEPAFLGRDVAFGLALNYRETDNETAEFDTSVGQFRPSLTFPISELGRLQLRYTLDYSDIRSNNLANVGDVVRAEAAQGERFDSALGYTLSYDSRRTGLDPTAGVLIETGMDFGGIGGDTSFVKSSLRAVGQRLAFSEDVTLRASLEAGGLVYTEGSSRVADRYVLGSRTMRGFALGGIGPRDQSNGADDPIGGNYFAVASFEAEFPLGLPAEYGISGGLFYDIGAVWGLSNFTRTSSANIVGEDFSARHVIGFSILWDSALGPLRLNFSEALVSESFDEPQGFDLTISARF